MTQKKKRNNNKEEDEKKNEKKTTTMTNNYSRKRLYVCVCMRACFCAKYFFKFLLIY